MKSGRRDDISDAFLCGFRCSFHFHARLQREQFRTYLLQICYRFEIDLEQISYGIRTHGRSVGKRGYNSIDLKQI